MFNATYESSNNEKWTLGAAKTRQNIDVQLNTLTMNARRVMVRINRRLANERKKNYKLSYALLFPNRFVQIRFCWNDTRNKQVNVLYIAQIFLCVLLCCVLFAWCVNGVFFFCFEFEFEMNRIIISFIFFFSKNITICSDVLHAIEFWIVAETSIIESTHLSTCNETSKQTNKWKNQPEAWNT